MLNRFAEPMKLVGELHSLNKQLIASSDAVKDFIDKVNACSSHQEVAELLVELPAVLHMVLESHSKTAEILASDNRAGGATKD